MTLVSSKLAIRKPRSVSFLPCCHFHSSYIVVSNILCPMSLWQTKPLSKSTDTPYHPCRLDGTCFIQIGHQEAQILKFPLSLRATSGVLNLCPQCPVISDVPDVPDHPSVVIEESSVTASASISCLTNDAPESLILNFGLVWDSDMIQKFQDDNGNKKWRCLHCNCEPWSGQNCTKALHTWQDLARIWRPALLSSWHHTQRHI